MENPTVSIGIVGWNSGKYLHRCLVSVLQQTYKNIDLFYFDNASQDNSVPIVKDIFPKANIIQSPENVGFGNAHNAIIKKSLGEYYLPLNPDVVLASLYLETMVRAFQNVAADIGSANGKILFLRGEQKTSIVYSRGHLLTRDRRIENIGHGFMDSPEPKEPSYIFGFNGACPLLKREMIKDVSIDGAFFDPLFFMYGEDYDVNWRAQLLGWKCIYVPQAVAWHDAQGSKGLEQTRVLMQYQRNRYLLLLKNDRFIHFLMDMHHFLLVDFIFNIRTYLLRPSRYIAFLKIFPSFIANIPYAIRMRRIIEKKRKVEHVYIRSLFDARPWKRYLLISKRLLWEKIP